MLNPDVILKNDTLLNINNSISKLDNFAILSPLSDNPAYPNYRLNKSKSPNYDNNLIKDVEEIDGYSMINNKNFLLTTFFSMKNSLCT